MARPVMESSVKVGGLIDLLCTLKTAGISDSPLVVFWIKTSAHISTCVYSFYFTSSAQQGFDENCVIDNDLQIRRSTTSKNSHQNHNIMIRNASQSDSGQYLCVVDILRENHRYWTILTNITVTVGDPALVKPGKNHFIISFK